MSDDRPLRRQDPEPPDPHVGAEGYRGLRPTNQTADGSPHDRGRRPRWLDVPRWDHALLIAGAIVITIGSSMPWIVGSTRRRGNIDWTGFNDTGEGAMLMGCAFVALLFVRWRGVLEGGDPRWRWMGMGAALAALGLWVIAFRKVLSLAWWEIEPGARPQLGIYVAFAGVILTLAGAAIAVRRRANEDVARRARRQVARGRPPSAFDQEGRVGADGYAVRGRVDPRNTGSD
jgi:hypothetical protein